MKNLLIGLLTFSSVASYASCNLTAEVKRGYDLYESEYSRTHLSNRNMLTTMLAIDSAIEAEDKEKNCKRLQQRLNAIAGTIQDLKK